jgi:hypothetical protein
MLSRILYIHELIKFLVFIYTTLEVLCDFTHLFNYWADPTHQPFVKPILKTATTGLMSASSEVINNQDQYEVRAP